MSISADGHDFTVFHPETGETLQISQVYGVNAGSGVPGSSDGGAMHVSCYFQALPKIERGTGSVVEGVEENETCLEGEGGMEDVSTPSEGRGNPSAGAVGDDTVVEDYDGTEDSGEGGEDDGTEGIMEALERVSPVRNLLVTKEASRYLWFSRVLRALEIVVDGFRLSR